MRSLENLINSQSLDSFEQESNAYVCIKIPLLFALNEKRESIRILHLFKALLYSVSVSFGNIFYKDGNWFVTTIKSQNVVIHLKM